ncbi:hypothetical protein THL1_2794 [Pseudomonas sp. TCU-HL1]|nr:hypothetical protein THL1_2794 [Pseudomonas sp. TCU-HL1]
MQTVEMQGGSRFSYGVRHFAFHDRAALPRCPTRPAAMPAVRSVGRFPGIGFTVIWRLRGTGPALSSRENSQTIHGA